MGAPSVTIASLGQFLPPLRFNDWWSPEVVASWSRAAGDVMTTSPMEGVEVTDGVRATLDAIEKVSDDPFRGIISRPVMPEGMRTSDMEIEAARDALSRSGVAADSIGVLIQQSSGNDFVSPQNACRVHDALGLRRDCLVVGTECNYDSFSVQLTLAESLLRCGVADTALLVQSSANTRLVPPNAAYAPWFGDGATAQILQCGAAGEGILGRAHAVDGAFFRTFGVAGPGGRPWYLGGDVQFCVEDSSRMRRMFLMLADLTRETMTRALGMAGVSATDIAFFASHQATVWLGEVMRSASNLDNARTWNTCRTLASVGACNVPLVLHAGSERGLLRDGDLVALQSGGAGTTWSSMILRWGR